MSVILQIKKKRETGLDKDDTLDKVTRVQGSSRDKRGFKCNRNKRSGGGD